MLAERPDIKYAVVVDDLDADPMIRAFPIRERASCELLIPRERYDGALLLDLMNGAAGPCIDAASFRMTTRARDLDSNRHLGATMGTTRINLATLSF